jgi:hypothetical protein
MSNVTIIILHRVGSGVTSSGVNSIKLFWSIFTVLEQWNPPILKRFSLRRREMFAFINDLA